MSPSSFLRALLSGAGVALLVVLASLAWGRFGQGTGGERERPKLDVPYVATIEEVVDRMLALAEVRASDHVIDLGSGDGRILVAAARTRGATGFGVDIDPARIAEAEANARAGGVADKVRFRLQDLFEAPIADASVIAIYLLPEINLRLRPRFLAELRPGTRIVSHAFDMGDWRPDRTEQVEGARIFLWIVPARVAGRWTLTGRDGRSAAVTLAQHYQDVSGNVRDARLSGDRLRFVADLGDGPRAYHGRVRGDRIEPLSPDEGWRMARTR